MSIHINNSVNCLKSAIRQKKNSTIKWNVYHLLAYLPVIQKLGLFREERIIQRYCNYRAINFETSKQQPELTYSPPPESGSKRTMHRYLQIFLKPEVEVNLPTAPDRNSTQGYNQASLLPFRQDHSWPFYTLISFSKCLQRSGYLTTYSSFPSVVLC